MERERIVCGDKLVEHNAVPWDVQRDYMFGVPITSYGVLIGPPVLVRWDNATIFGLREAKQVVKIHNKWLLEQDPLDLEIMKLEDYIKEVTSDIEEAEREVRSLHADREHYRMELVILQRRKKHERDSSEIHQDTQS